MKPVESLEQLQEMCHISALSGHEEDMIAYMKGEMSGYVSNLRVDRLGNVIATREGNQPGGPKVMISAHMDELGFMVRKIEPSGFVRITRVGGVPEKSLPAQRLRLAPPRAPSRPWRSRSVCLLRWSGPSSHDAWTSSRRRSNPCRKTAPRFSASSFPPT